MATFYDSLPLNTVLRLVKMELVEACETTRVKIKTIEYDDEIYCYNEGYNEEKQQHLTAVACVEGAKFASDNGEHPWLLEWSCNMSMFISVGRTDQEDKNDKENETW